ncbi:MAG: hypothetical protein J6P58_09395 [Oscillospiraceae bacterium]|nr:hypothetical protein [Oscillospiraceae bacterium]
MKKSLFVLAVAAVMLIVSRFVVRIVDATVGIDDDAWVLALLLVTVNAAIGYLAYRIRRRRGK